MHSRHSAWLIMVIGSIIVVSAALASCGVDTSAPELQQANVELYDNQSNTDDNLAPTQISLDVHIEPFTDQECLDCHTDQIQLETLAVEEEVVSHSEGPG